jgi:enoyl-[acyl-carrier-protein] reductase (NADH)
MQDLMKGKRGLIMGVANDHSIAWGIAKTLHAQGADLAFTYQGDALGKRVKPLAQSLGVDTVLSCDVEDIASVDSVFAALKARWGQLDFLVHALRSPTKRAQGPLCRHQPREFFANHAGLVFFVHGACEARGRADAFIGGRDDHADLRRLDAGDAEL